MTIKTRFIKEKNLEIFKITVKKKKPLVSIEKNQKFLKTHLIFNDDFTVQRKTTFLPEFLKATFLFL